MVRSIQKDINEQLGISLQKFQANVSKNNHFYAYLSTTIYIRMTTLLIEGELA